MIPPSLGSVMPVPGRENVMVCPAFRIPDSGAFFFSLSTRFPAFEIYGLGSDVEDDDALQSLVRTHGIDQSGYYAHTPICGWYIAGFGNSVTGNIIGMEALGLEGREQLQHAIGHLLV